MVMKVRSAGSVKRMAKERVDAFTRKLEIAERRKALEKKEEPPEEKPKTFIAPDAWKENKRLEVEFRTAVLQGDTKKVMEMLKMGVYSEPKTNDEWNAMITAAANGHEQIVSRLLSFCAEVDAIDSFGNTALMYASRYGHLDIVKNLLKNGAELAAKGEKGRNALMFAAENGQIEVIRYFIKEEAYLNSRDDDKKTAVTLANERGHDKVVNLLRRHGGRK